MWGKMPPAGCYDSPTESVLTEPKQQHSKMLAPINGGIIARRIAPPQA